MTDPTKPTDPDLEDDAPTPGAEDLPDDVKTGDIGASEPEPDPTAHTDEEEEPA